MFETMKNLNLASIDVTVARDLKKELTEFIKAMNIQKRTLKKVAKEEKAAARAEKRAKQVEALMQRIERLQNPVGYQKMRAARKPGVVKVTKG
jgi:glucose-6-phosphate-specific signal transduction histidine kinase